MRSFITVCAAFTTSAIAAETKVDYTRQELWAKDAQLCANGKEQSPINLTMTGVSYSKKVGIKGYGYDNLASTTVTRKQSTIEFASTGGEFEIGFADGKKSEFESIQTHFHAPSEHTVEGQQYDLEMHIVHKYKKTGELGAVLGFFFDRKAGGNVANPLIESLKFAQTVEGAAITVDNVALSDFLATADFSEYWSYPGSLTVPPCVEGIKWTVIKKPLPISDAQLNAFKKFFADNKTFANGLGNNRLIQPLNARTLYFTSATSMATSVLTFAMAAYCLF